MKEEECFNNPPKIVGNVFFAEYMNGRFQSRSFEIAFHSSSLFPFVTFDLDVERLMIFENLNLSFRYYLLTLQICFSCHKNTPATCFHIL